jgi:hypothetical protein
MFPNSKYDIFIKISVSLGKRHGQSNLSKQPLRSKGGNF